MSQFIDYTKRSVTLPAGCRDLMDVLRRDEARSGEHPVSTRQESATGRLSDVGQYVGKVFESKADLIHLIMVIPTQGVTIHLAWANRAMRMFSVTFDLEADRERAMSAFCELHRFEQSKETGTPTPRQSMYAVPPLPSDPDAISALVTELLGDVCRLDDKAVVGFWWCERTKPF